MHAYDTCHNYQSNTVSTNPSDKSIYNNNKNDLNPAIYHIKVILGMNHSPFPKLTSGISQQDPDICRKMS